MWLQVEKMLPESLPAKDFLIRDDFWCPVKNHIEYLRTWVYPRPAMPQTMKIIKIS